MKLETLLPLGKVDPGLREPGTPFDIHTVGEQAAHVGQHAGGRVGYVLHTADFAAAHARMTAAGVHFEEAPRHEPYGTVAVFRDLYGNRWDLIEPKRQV